MANIRVDGMIRVFWVASISNIAAPTVAELNAGINLTSTLTKDGLIGFGPETARVDATGLDSTFEEQDVGTATFGDGVKLRLKKQTGTDTIYTTLIYGAAGYVVIRRNLATGTAWAIAQLAEVIPSICGYRQYLDPEMNTLSRYEVPIAVSKAANLDAVVA